MKTLALTVALLSAAPLTADDTETRVRVALALSACQCETNCADPAKDLAEKVAVALKSPVPKRNPTADGTETRVRVALALSAGRCETPGKNCADQAKDLAEKVAVALKSSAPKRNPTDTDRYSAFLASVRQGKSGVLRVGEGDGPCDCRVAAGYAGLAPGLYRCYLKDGIPMMEAIPSAPPIYRYPVCTTGRCR
jgi:hypothetical protein